MNFYLQKFLPNIVDVVKAGGIEMQKTTLRAEFLTNHRLSERYPVAKILPKGGVGAEVGVFTGLFSSVLLDIARPKKMYFVDPWWKEFGQKYPDWGVYTDNGSLTTETAHRMASRRIANHSRGTESEIIVDHSTKFFPRVPNEYFDWVYLDSTHSYDGTCEELKLIWPKLKCGGYIAGDDWIEDTSHHHFGVSKAVLEAIRQNNFEELRIFPALQWVVRKPF